MTPLALLDLFSGIGGFSLGLEASGAFETAAFCEIDAGCRRLLALRWPGVRIYDDVRTLGAAALAGDDVRIDAVCGGFPCRDISLAGKGGGLDGKRSGLWREYARLVRELRPRFVIVENVAALLGRGMAVVLGELSACGYDAVWRRIAAADVGAPHLRQRVWIVAYARSEQPEGFGDALWRSLAEEFPGAAADADGEGEHDGALDAEMGGASEFAADAFGGELRFEPGRLFGADRTGPAELADDGVAELLADAESGGQRADGRPSWSGGHADECGAPGFIGGIWLAQPRLGGMADGLSDRLDFHPAWLTKPAIPRVLRDVHRRKARLQGLGNAVVPEIPRRIGRALSRALQPSPATPFSAQRGLNPRETSEGS